MLDLLASTPLLTLFLVIALGTLLGAIPFGPVRFGPAGALFVGLAVGALDPRLGEGLGLVQSVGLALFVYTIGIAAGRSFFRDLRRQGRLMIGAVVLLVLYAAAAVLLGRLTGVGPGLTGGLFTGSLTSTPALAAATAATGSREPAVGYSISYPIGVTLAIVAVSVLVRRRWPAPRDPEPLSGAGLLDITVEVARPVSASEVPGVAAERVRLSYLARDGAVRVARPGEQLLAGDRVVLVGVPATVEEAAAFLGRRVDTHLAHDRSEIDFRRYVVSHPAVAGRTVGELDIPGRFNGILTRIRRGDTDLLAHEDTVLELGDRVRVVVPRDRMNDVSRLFGDSERKVTEVDFFTLGIGLAIGIALGTISIPLGGGLSFALGSAAGPLLVGLVLGRLERTGPFLWNMPLAANLTIRQLGLVMFLAAVGLASGQAFAQRAFTLTGLKIALAAAVLVALGCFAFAAMSRALGLSVPRTAGGLAGFVGQPAILAYASNQIDDERVDSGYAALYALSIIAKIVLVQAVVAL